MGATLDRIQNRIPRILQDEFQIQLAQAARRGGA
jgi:hypothetical protein